MELEVVHAGDGHRLDGGGLFAEVPNRYLGHLSARGLSPGSVPGYAYDLELWPVSGRSDASSADVVATDLFDYLDRQARPAATAGPRVVRLSAGCGAGDDEWRITAVRGLFRTGRVSHNVLGARSLVAASGAEAIPAWTPELSVAAR